MKTNLQSTTGGNELDRRLAVPMFLVALAFLLIAGFLIHTESSDLPAAFSYSEKIQLWGIVALGLLYLCYIAEAVAHWWHRSNYMRRHIWYLVIPFLRLCPRDHLDGSHAWIVGLGWQPTSVPFERYIGRLFSGPMIGIALLVLPVVGAEWFLAKQIEASPNGRFIIQSATGFIWMAFVFEFVVMITIVEKKVQYCKQNWIDIAVILLPLIAFLRAARLGRLMKLQQLSRTAKMYRMRGLALRAWRAFVTLDVIGKLLRRTPQQRFERLRSEILEKQEEIRHLKMELEQVRAEVDAHQVDSNSDSNQGGHSKIEMNFSYQKK